MILPDGRVCPECTVGKDQFRNVGRKQVQDSLLFGVFPLSFLENSG
jgi:hypothetical protein